MSWLFASTNQQQLDTIVAAIDQLPSFFDEKMKAGLTKAMSDQLYYYTPQALKECETTCLQHKALTEQCHEIVTGCDAAAKEDAVIIDSSDEVKFDFKSALDSQLVDHLVQSEKCRAEFTINQQLVKRIPLIIGKVKGNCNHWIEILLQPGLLSTAQHAYLMDLLQYMIQKILSCSETSDLYQLLNDLEIYCRTIGAARQKADDFAQLRKKSAVKGNIASIESKANFQPKVTKIIQTKPVAISQNFIKAIGNIHAGRVDQQQSDQLNRVAVTETYANGQSRLRGQKLDGKKIGKWRWYYPTGEPMAEFDYNANWPLDSGWNNFYKDIDGQYLSGYHERVQIWKLEVRHH